MSKHVATTAEAEISPKVKAVGWTGGLLFVAVTVVSVVLTSVTPDMLGALGPWAGPVAAGLVAGGAALAGYLKRDPLRGAGGAVVGAGTVVPEIPAAAVGAQEAVAVEPATGSTVAPAGELSVAEATVEADALAKRAAELRREV